MIVEQEVVDAGQREQVTKVGIDTLESDTTTESAGGQRQPTQLVDVLDTSCTLDGHDAQPPSAAALNAAMSILPMPSIAVVARAARSGSGSASKRWSSPGTTCHDSPY